MKYRFPDIKDILMGKTPVQSKQLPYVKYIKFKYITNHRLRVDISYQSNRKVSPKFILLLFDNNGVNIHRQDISYTTLGFKRYIKGGKQLNKSYKVKILNSGVPRYFLMRKSL